MIPEASEVTQATESSFAKVTGTLLLIVDLAIILLFLIFPSSMFLQIAIVWATVTTFLFVVLPAAFSLLFTRRNRHKKETINA